ncbi:Plastidal glycolate/glycerate translocator 1, chloroplastic [Ananas comosus]|uniref:Plastidal glycolate/glycerate translocator 1, chloroplastic n=1 Tax=Ananas comosus TaxID=4615 RepID=A0A199UPB3_ANACO|nr:Plastidal glycolate/glycerate translocator 1, chloroplastic [Ananas comosus]
MAAASTIRIRPAVSALPLTTSTLRKPTSIPTTRCPSPSLPRPIVSSRFNPSSSPPPRSLGPRFGFRHTDNGDDDVRHRNLLVPARSAGTEAGQAAFGFPTIVKFLHLAVSLGIILAADKLLRKAFLAASIKFPSALFGMFCVFSVLMILDSTAPSAATGFMNFFEPATLFIQRWLPLFYVPSLVVLPLAVRDVPAASGLKIFLILVGGWLASLMVAGYTAITVRRIVQTEMIPAEPMTKPSPFTAVELWAWAAIFVLSFALALVYPTALSTSAGTCLPFLLAATVLGYMIGSGLPSNVKQVFHPIICCAASADLAALAYGYLSRSGMDACFASCNQCTSSCLKGANASLTAAAVVLTGLVGANFVQAVMDKLRLNDPIARGIATASSAHGLGTAALSAKEPEALPFCAIAYALTGIFGSLICSVPAVRQSLVLIAG